jgi:DnaJ-class molecular chaperone
MLLHTRSRSLTALVASDTDTPAEPISCSPCRGTGKVISNLGGSPSTIDCPWCEGTGTFIADHDAQARHLQTDQTASSGGEGSANGG